MKRINKFDLVKLVLSLAVFIFLLVLTISLRNSIDNLGNTANNSSYAEADLITNYYLGSVFGFIYIFLSFLTILSGLVSVLIIIFILIKYIKNKNAINKLKE